MKPMTIGSLFAGIGGFELGLERARVGVTVWQVEKDEWRRRVLAKHFPEARRYGDVETVGAHNLEAVDVICGGFPCQDLSVAGRRKGLDAPRSGLWDEFRRIVETLRPRYVLVENISHGRDRWLPYVRGDLQELGWCTTAYRVGASDVGASHARQRIFVLAHADAEPLRLLQQRPPSRWTRGVRDARKSFSMDHGAGWDAAGSPDWSSSPGVCRVDDGVSAGLDARRLEALGDAIVPQVAAVMGHLLLAATRRHANET